MAGQLIKGFPSTSGDDFQLNTITLLKHADAIYPEVEIVDRNLDGSMFRYTYKDAYTRVKRLANALKRLGIKPGDRVGVMEINTHRFFELYFAISGLGAVLVQINPRISDHDRAYVINHAGVSFLFVNELLVSLVEPFAHKLEQIKGYAVITDKPLDQVTTALSPRVGYEEILAGESDDCRWEMIDENSAFSACYTSGTTGLPKGVFYSHRAIYLHTLTAAACLKIDSRDVVMQTVPMFHCHGWGFFLAAAMVGSKLVFPGLYTAETTNVLVDLMVSEKVTVNNGAPAIFLPMLEYIKTLDVRPDFTGLRMASGATEPSLALMKGFWELGGAEIVHAYGATETAPFVTANLRKPSLDTLSGEEKWELKKKQGLPVAGLDFRIVDFEGKEVPHDGATVGEVLVRGPWITSSYYNDERTKDSFVDGYWKSGDGGTMDENGFFKIADRFKDMIKSGGEWISSIDLENAVMGHPGVLEASVVGIPHPKWEERPLALVVRQGGDWEEESLKEEIYGLLTEKFARWQFPDEIVFVQEIPKTSVGKFSKKDIRAAYQDFYM
ncbi:MAG: long-chain fatty acid--CoA ligase [Desulfobacteraceae bacterium]|nr:long-chain fatty acid--CoA ligase [Desulfobacteraceae bacterium]